MAWRANDFWGDGIGLKVQVSAPFTPEPETAASLKIPHSEDSVQADAFPASPGIHPESGYNHHMVTRKWEI